MYLSKNYPTKAAAKRGIAAGDVVRLKPTALVPQPVPTNGRVGGIEGPWYPEPHRWYGTVTVVDGLVVKVV